MMTRSIIPLIFLIVSSSRGEPIRPAFLVDVDSPSSSSSASSSMTSSILVGLARSRIDDYDDYDEDKNNVTTTSPVTSSPTITSTPPPPPSIAPRPTIPPTPAPSKRYVSPDDENDDRAGEIEREMPKITKVLLWVSMTFGIIWITCYFRDVILFFVGNVS
jgi:hypothetical protein